MVFDFQGKQYIQLIYGKGYHDLQRSFTNNIHAPKHTWGFVYFQIFQPQTNMRLKCQVRRNLRIRLYVLKGFPWSIPRIGTVLFDREGSGFLGEYIWMCEYKVVGTTPNNSPAKWWWIPWDRIPYHPWDDCIFSYILVDLMFMVNVGKYNIHGWYGNLVQEAPTKQILLKRCNHQKATHPSKDS